MTFTSIQSHAQHKYFLFFCLQILLLLVVFFYSPEVQIILMSLMCFDQPSGLQAINLFVIHPGVLASDFSILLCEKNFPFLISCSRCGWNSLSFGIDRRYWEIWCKLNYGINGESRVKVLFNVQCQVAIVTY